jgi:hypothetical protein
MQGKAGRDADFQVRKRVLIKTGHFSLFEQLKSFFDIYT